ncbi:hypothetical protein [Schinkia azotoformans]|uniref:hypothetical protein n=1 Tax=Schinkia azotoformans TaxID=1454 RepID=UPI002DB67985|nr:hypothetical protein [Schinkia azotoformans]MEC1780078.1 hypothetical protein [Schinkia azotoformans]MED4330843.1 hypothetical protein [Schinkia azotoformans]
MRNIAYLVKEANMTPFEVLKLPYSMFLSLLKHFRLMEIESTPEGRELLRKDKMLKETKPDLTRIRSMKSYNRG